MHLRLGKFIQLLFSGILLLLLVQCQPEDQTNFTQRIPEKVDFNQHIKPILSDRCFACHGPDQKTLKADLRLDLEETAFAAIGDQKDRYAIVAGDVDASEIIHRIFSDDPEKIMPPPESNLTLSPYEKKLIEQWIEEGAEWKTHWAFIPPKKPEIPLLKDRSWPKNELDHFVLAQMENHQLAPAPEASKEKLLRRLSFDLRGLPPTPEELSSFISQEGEDAYEQWVDTYLASPHYGEHMAISWLDAARYADSHGYQDDRPRTMWPWRDWVVKAFNNNMPYDSFAIYQLAGDLLPNAGYEQKLATAFNRNHGITQEGGVVPEEYITEYVADRTNTMATTFMGLTMECARCHDHKYDPISTKEYYQSFAFFNTLDEQGQINYFDEAPKPNIRMEDSTLEATLRYLNQQSEAQEERVHLLRKANWKTHSGFQQWKSQQMDKLDWDAQLKKALITRHRLDDFSRLMTKSEIQGAPIAKANTGLLNELDSPSSVEGIKGKGLKFDGSNFLNLGDIGDFEYFDPFSLSCWVFTPSKLEKDAGILVKRNGEQKRGGYELAITRDFRLKFSLVHHHTEFKIELTSTQKIAREEWTHLAISYTGSGTAEGIRLYINGEPQKVNILKDQLEKKSILNGNALLAGNWTPRKVIRGDIHGFTEGVIDEIAVYRRELSPLEIKQLAANLKSANTQDWFTHYLIGSDPVFLRQNKMLDSLRREHFTIPYIMVMEETDNKRKSYVLDRGAYDAPTIAVSPSTPKAILEFPDDELARNRLGLAQWLTKPQHPLTARVEVNRIWQNIFGRGLVKTAEDFGNQGDLPSHPLLLDYLSVEFIESGWDVKQLIKKIVMSSTYRQSSRISQQKYDLDPDNIFLSRGQNTRLKAEMIRDQALASSGLLNPAIGGKWVKPYQPPGVWKELANQIGENKYRPSLGKNRHRRSLYSYWKRTIPPPAMLTFDAAERTVCVAKRQQTNTPLQALVLLNDPQFVEASIALATRMLEESPQLNDQISFGFSLMTSRRPSDKEIDILSSLYQKNYQEFINDPEKASDFLNDYPLFVSAKKKNDLAAMAVLANILINLDEAKMKS